MKDSNCYSIIIEGLDSLGKSLQTRLVVERLRAAHYRVEHVKSPYNDSFTFKLIYWMLGNGLARKLPNVFQVIHFLNKLIFQTFVLPKLLRENDFVIFDRWSLSMWAYGVMDGANESLTSWMLSVIAEPDFTVILDGVRHDRERADDSYESDVSYQKRVRMMYLNWAIDIDHENVVIVNANQSVDEVTTDIFINMLKKGFRV